MAITQVTHSTAEILARLCQSAAQAVGGLAAEVALWDDAEQQLIIQAFSGPQPPARGWAVGDGALGRTWREPKPVLTPTSDGLEPEVLGFATAAGADALFIVPILNPNRVMGLLLVFRRGNPGLVMDDIDLLGLFAQHAANALENAELADRQQALVDGLAAAKRGLQAETARRQSAEAAQRQAQERFDILFRNSPAGIALARLEDGCLLDANDSYVRRTGYPRDELIGHASIELGVLSAEQRENVVNQVRQGGSARNVEVTIRTKAGERRQILFSMERVEVGGEACTLSMLSDITERKNEEQKFRGLLESAPDAMVIGDRQGNINLVNSQTEKLFGYTREELLGQPMDMLVPTRFHVQHPDQRTRYLGEPRVRPFGAGLDLYGLRKDGAEFPVEISLNPLETEDALLVITVMRDASERKRFEQELGAQNLELEKAGLALSEKNVELERASLAKDRFLASMSHELRTPLNAVLGFTGTLLMRLPGPLTPDQEKQLLTIRTSARHLLSLINDLLDLAKIESGKVELSLEPVSCREVMDEVVATLSPLADAKHLKLRADFPPADIVLQTDRRALSQIVINLTNNAIKFTEAGQVRLALSQALHHGRRLTEIRVEDTGIGMRPEDQVQLFQAFEQLANSGVRQHEGTGLGLYLSQRLATLLGGRIEFESQAGQGSVFKLLIQEA